MQRLSKRQPLLFGVIVTLIFALGLLFCVSVLPHGWLSVGKVATRILIPVVFLTVLGWWRTAGFTQRPTWSTIVPFLPLLLMPLFPVVFGPGVAVSDPVEIAVLMVMNLSVGFGEEAVFRGVVLRALAPRGLLRAALLSSVLFGLMHLVNLTGDNPVNVAFQVVYTALIGFAFAAAALVTGAIWPLVVIHFAMDFANAIQTTTSGTGSAASIDIASGLINVALWIPFAAYGYWLLRRHLHQPSTGAPRATRQVASAQGGD